MHAYNLTAKVPANRRLVLEVPDGIPPGLVEILVLIPESATEIHELEDRIDLEAFRKAKEEPGEDIAGEDLKAELDL